MTDNTDTTLFTHRYGAARNGTLCVPFRSRCRVVCWGASRGRLSTHIDAREGLAFVDRLFRRPHTHGQPDDVNASKFKPAASPEDKGGSGLMTQCPHCNATLYLPELHDNLRVCPKCGHHLRLSARERIAYTLDLDTFTEWDANLRPADPLGFDVEGTYADKLTAAQRKTGERDTAVTGRGDINGEPLALFVADFGFMGGSMGGVFGEKLARAAERAVREQLPLVTFNTSGGARMQEGLFSLMQMAKTTAAVTALGNAGLPHLSVLVDPCYGGVTASYAVMADVVLAEPGALIGFAGKRAIAQIMRKALPDDAQTAEFQLAHGMIDDVIPRREMRQTLATLLALYRTPRLPAKPTDAETADADREPQAVEATSIG